MKAKLNNLRISPRKVRLSTKLIQGMEVEEARIHLRFLNKRAASHLLKLLDSAVANVQNKTNKGLYVAKIEVNEGPTFKRFRARARGRGAAIRKRTSKISLVLGEKIN